MATSSSIWSRVKTRWMSWNHTVQPQAQHPAQPPRYEYPEAHRHSNNQRIPNSTSTSTTTSALKDPNELLQQQLVDHPLHQTYYQRWLHNSLRGVAKFVFWTTAHATAMYLFYFYIKPRLHKYFQHVQLLQGGDDDDDDDCDDVDDDDNYNNNNDEGDNNNNSDDSSFTRWKRRLWNKWNGICTTSKNPNTKTSTPTNNKSKLKKRLCCCCDAKVSARDNYCPSCGSPTFPLCIYCGEGLPTNVNFCPSCGRPVPHQVIVDGGEGEGDGRTSPNTSLLSLPQRHALSSQRRSSTGSTLSSHNNFNNNSPGNTTNSPTQSHLPVTQFPHHAVLRPPYLTHTTSSQCQEKEDATTLSSFAEAESVPFVQADDYLPLVPAMYVEEVTAIPAPTTLVEPSTTVASNATTVATSGSTNTTSNSAQQQGDDQDQQQQQISSSSQQYDSVNDDSNTKESSNKQQ